MNYKYIFLSVLLLPVTVTSYGKGVEDRIKELQEAQFQKEIEISNLSELIVKRYESLNHYQSNAQYFWSIIQEKKIEILRKKNALSEEERLRDLGKIKTLFDQFIKNFEAAFNATKDITQMIEKESFDQESFDTLRIALLRVVLEQRLIEKLALKYEAFIQELIEIDKELVHLKNR